MQEAMRAGDWRAALRRAAKFQDLGGHKKAITLGHEAAAHPGFYRQLGHDPAALIEGGKRALIGRYGFGE